MWRFHPHTRPFKDNCLQSDADGNAIELALKWMSEWTFEPDETDSVLRFFADISLEGPRLSDGGEDEGSNRITSNLCIIFSRWLDLMIAKDGAVPPKMQCVPCILFDSDRIRATVRRMIKADECDADKFIAAWRALIIFPSELAPADHQSSTESPGGKPDLGLRMMPVSHFLCDFLMSWFQMTDHTDRHTIETAIRLVACKARDLINAEDAFTLLLHIIAKGPCPLAEIDGAYDLLESTVPFLRQQLKLYESTGVAAKRIKAAAAELLRVISNLESAQKSGSIGVVNRRNLLLDDGTGQTAEMAPETYSETNTQRREGLTDWLAADDDDEWFASAAGVDEQPTLEQLFGTKETDVKSVAQNGDCKAIDDVLLSLENFSDLTVSSMQWRVSAGLPLDLNVHYLRGNRSEGGPGLRNIGNTCFANAFIQALYLTTSFVVNVFRFNLQETTVEDEFGESPTLLRELKSLLAQMITTRDASVDPSDFLARLSPALFPRGVQGDASELGRYILNALGGHEKPLISTIFAGVVINEVECFRCHKVSSKKEIISDFSLPVDEANRDGASLSDLLKMMTAPEVLDGPNKYFCDHCGRKRRARRSTKIASPPAQIMIVINRFKWDAEKGERVKLQKRVHLDRHITLLSFPFRLYAAIMHKGRTPNSGHYYTVGGFSEPIISSDELAIAGTENVAVSRHRAAEPRAFVFDDSTVTPIAERGEELSAILEKRSESPVCEDETPYVVFYRCTAAPLSPALRVPAHLIP